MEQEEKELGSEQEETAAVDGEDNAETEAPDYIHIEWAGYI
jgi:hypothetical protein